MLDFRCHHYSGRMIFSCLSEMNFVGYFVFRIVISRSSVLATRNSCRLQNEYLARDWRAKVSSYFQYSSFLPHALARFRIFQKQCHRCDRSEKRGFDAVSNDSLFPTTPLYLLPDIRTRQPAFDRVDQIRVASVHRVRAGYEVWLCWRKHAQCTKHMQR